MDYLYHHFKPINLLNFVMLYFSEIGFMGLNFNIIFNKNMFWGSLFLLFLMENELYFDMRDVWSQLIMDTYEVPRL